MTLEGFMTPLGTETAICTHALAILNLPLNMEVVALINHQSEFSNFLSRGLLYCRQSFSLRTPEDPVPLAFIFATKPLYVVVPWTPVRSPGSGPVSLCRPISLCVK